MGDRQNRDLRVQFDRRLNLKFLGSKVTTDAGLLAYRELDEALGLSEMSEEVLTDSRLGSNKQHQLVPLLRQSVYSRLPGYEDVNDHETLDRIQRDLDSAYGDLPSRAEALFQLAEIRISATLLGVQSHVYVHAQNMTPEELDAEVLGELLGLARAGVGRLAEASHRRAHR